MKGFHHEESGRPEGKGSWSCTGDPTSDLREMFVNVVQGGRIQEGQLPARRPVFLKPHGVAHGTFQVREDMPEDLKVGVFGMKSLPAWVRFSSDTIPSQTDLRTTCGIGIKLFGVPGPKLLGDGETQDFLLQNHDVFFVNTAKDMCEFTKAGVIGGNYDPYLRVHPVTKKILDEMRKVEISALTATYWSVLPYSFGADRYVKYKLEPEQQPAGQAPADVPDYLAIDLVQRLLKGPVRFRFLVQFRTHPATMPLDEATVRWSESESEPVHLATLILPQQDLGALGQAIYGENLAFNPWHTLAEHRPQGSISEVRKEVYAASAGQRRNANGIPVAEPREARPAAIIPPLADRRIVKAAIHPSMGIARIGNSPDEFFIGPEVTAPVAKAPGFYRDATGALKRQAAQFRIYGLDAEGNVVKELTSVDARIEWSVHLANKKAAWYQFQLALDIPEAASASPSLLRNISVEDRSQLSIDPGPRHVVGPGRQGGSEHVFDSGKFLGKPVYLGELRTDGQGRLLVLGGHGVSASCDGSKAVTFANNDGWHDDVSDGPVTAKVSFEGLSLEVAPAWVVVAPPNYAPLQKSVRTMWDLMRDVAIQAGMLTRPPRPSFENDIRPIFERLSNLQWVNAGFAAAFGWGGPNDFTRSEWMGRLADSSFVGRELRRTIANHFRVFDRDAWSPAPWPWLYGDAMNIPPAHTPRQHAALTDTQLWFLQQWAQGDFEPDYDPGSQPPLAIDEVPIAQQAAMLDRAALEYCLADAFHPGCEMTWPMRTATIYMAPFRIKHAPADWKEPGNGPALTPDVLTLPNGPLGAQVPGGITRWMAVPWQTDTASCLSGYDPTYDSYVPSFWPARVPNQVLGHEDYKIVLDKSRPLAERQAAFANRLIWIEALHATGYTDQINRMVSDFGKLGVVEELPGVEGSEHFPPTMQVEHFPPTHARKAPRTPIDPAELQRIEKVHRFPHGLRE